MSIPKTNISLHIFWRAAKSASTTFQQTYMNLKKVGKVSIPTTAIFIVTLLCKVTLLSLELVA